MNQPETHDILPDRQTSWDFESSSPGTLCGKRTRPGHGTMSLCTRWICAQPGEADFGRTHLEIPKLKMVAAPTGISRQTPRRRVGQGHDAVHSHQVSTNHNFLKVLYLTLRGLGVPDDRDETVRSKPWCQLPGPDRGAMETPNAMVPPSLQFVTKGPPKAKFRQAEHASMVLAAVTSRWNRVAMPFASVCKACPEKRALHHCP